MFLMLFCIGMNLGQLYTFTDRIVSCDVNDLFLFKVQFQCQMTNGKYYNFNNKSKKYQVRVLSIL